MYKTEQSLKMCSLTVSVASRFYSTYKKVLKCQTNVSKKDIYLLDETLTLSYSAMEAWVA